MTWIIPTQTLKACKLPTEITKTQTADPLAFTVASLLHSEEESFSPNNKVEVWMVFFYVEQ